MAAVELWWHDAVDESIPFFRIAATSNTGSGAEMAGLGILALLEGDYPKAASHFLQLIKRYNDKQGYREYMTLLHFMGYHKESWAIFNTIDIQSNSPDIWTTAFIGHRMESKLDEEIIQWLLQNNIHNVSFDYIGRYILMSHLIDRLPNQHLSDLIEEARGMIKNSSKNTDEKDKSHFAWFADGCYFLRKGGFIRSFEIFKERYNQLKGQYELYNYAIHYFVWVV